MPTKYPMFKAKNLGNYLLRGEIAQPEKHSPSNAKNWLIASIFFNFLVKIKTDTDLNAKLYFSFS